MTAVLVNEVSESETTDDGDDLVHWNQCHDEDRALCGADLAGDWVIVEVPTDDRCVVCEELVNQPCDCPPGCTQCGDDCNCGCRQ
jgi:hypothetical protein